MTNEHQWRWIALPASIVFPLAPVLLALQFQSGMWVMLAFAVGAAAAVGVVELSARRVPLREGMR